MQAYDYAQHGAYFFTAVARERVRYFGTVDEYGVRLSAAGRAVQQVWSTLTDRFTTIALDAFVVMPDHVHGIVWLDRVGAGLALPDGSASDVATLGEVIGAFKSLSARLVNAALTRSGPLWQRNYYEHVIRDERDLAEIRRYILDNPQRWWERHGSA